MPVYTYRREDGSTFDYHQKFSDDPLNLCPTTGQRVVRIVQPAGIIFKGAGFYVNDSRSASKSTLNGNGKHDSDNGAHASEKPDKATPAAKEAAPKKETPVTNPAAD